VAPVSPWLTAVLVACAVGNVGLTLYHWRIVRRSLRRQADTDRLHDDAERLLGELHAALRDAATAVGGANGTRPHVEPEAGPGV
jgi:membrane protein implicated in regulation of membrane protease activity